MGTQRYMVATKASFCALLVLLLIVIAISFMEKTGTREDFVAELLDPASELLDNDTIDCRDSSKPEINIEKAVELCDCNFGIGVDGEVSRLGFPWGLNFLMNYLIVSLWILINSYIIY